MTDRERKLWEIFHQLWLRHGNSDSPLWCKAGALLLEMEREARLYDNRQMRSR
jgi:hypothetical protein